MDPHEQSDRDFSRARRRAFLRRIGAYLRRDPGSNQLLSFDEVKGALGAVSQVYLGLREVPVSKIVGSVGRHRDFDRAFLPSKPDLGTRWRRIDEIMHRAEELPPVSLYKIGDAYFVQDGNHRVSVARQQGVEMIDAEVIELRSRVPVDSALTARDLLHKLEHRRLLERLPIDRVLPEIKVEFSDVADYRRLATYIEAHGFRISQLWKRYVSPEEVLEGLVRIRLLPDLGDDQGGAYPRRLPRPHRARPVPLDRLPPRASGAGGTRREGLTSGRQGRHLEECPPPTPPVLNLERAADERSGNRLVRRPASAL